MSSLVTAGRFRGTTTDPNVFYYEDMVVYNQMYNHMCKLITLSAYIFSFVHKLVIKRILIFSQNSQDVQK